MIGSLPKISIVTPSFNQAKFLEETIISVLGQNYPNTEYIIIDGASTDGSVDIIRKYERRLAYWISEPDRGMYEAINKGFAKSTGEIMAWLPGDDKYLPWTFQVVADIFAQLREVEWLASRFPLFWDDLGRATGCTVVEGYNKKAFLQGRNLRTNDRFSTFFIPQDSAFWRRSLWQRAGGRLNSDLKLAGDFDLWARFFQVDGVLYVASVPLGGFRFQPEQRSVTQQKEYSKEAEKSLADTGGRRISSAGAWFRYLLKSGVPNFLLRRSGLAFKGKTVDFNTTRHQWETGEIHFF